MNTSSINYNAFATNLTDKYTRKSNYIIGPNIRLSNLDLNIDFNNMSLHNSDIRDVTINTNATTFYLTEDSSNVLLPKKNKVLVNENSDVIIYSKDNKLSNINIVNI